MSEYLNEPFLKDIITKYTNNPSSIDVNSIVEYFNNKKNVRNGKPISNGSKVSQISTFKKVLMNIKDHAKLKELKMPLIMMNQVNEVRELGRTKRNSKKITITTAQVKQIMDGLKSKKFEELYPALLLVSGRKPSDLYDSIKKGPGKTLKIKQPIKKRNHECDIQYTVPLLSTFAMFNKGIKNLHLLFPEIKEMTSSEIAKKLSKPNANAMLDLSKKLKIKLISSDLRIIYVNELYNKSPKDISLTDFISTVIDNDPVEISLNYEQITIVP
jgi:hypothetical protein